MISPDSKKWNDYVTLDFSKEVFQKTIFSRSDRRPGILSGIKFYDLGNTVSYQMEVKNDRKDEGETDGTGCSKRIWHGNE